MVSHVKRFVGVVPTSRAGYTGRVEPPSPNPASPLLAAAARLLRPLVRLLIRSGVVCPTLMEVLRTVYVEEARRLLPDERARTDSRISLMTGIHRKELRRSREVGVEPAPVPVTVGSQVASRWLGQKGMQDAAGRPIPLPRSAAPGEPSFEALVASVTRDVRSRAVLDDWLEHGLVTIDGENRLVLQAEAFLPRPGHAEQLFYFGRNLHDHMAAAAANVDPDAGQAPFLERSVHYDGLSDAAAADLARVAREAAQRMLLEVNRAALTIAEADDAAAAGAARTHRVNLGAYLFAAEDPP